MRSRKYKEPYKPGDRVRCVDNAHSSKLIALGCLGTVDNPPYRDNYLMVKRDGEKESRGWYEKRWEPAEGLLMPDTREYLSVLSEAQTDR